MKEYKTELVWQTGAPTNEATLIRRDAISMKNQLNKTIGEQANEGWVLQFMTPYTRGDTCFIVLTFEREKASSHLNKTIVD